MSDLKERLKNAAKWAEDENDHIEPQLVFEALARIEALEAWLTAARDALRKVSLSRRAIGPIATLAQAAAWEVSALLRPTDGRDGNV